MNLPLRKVAPPVTPRPAATTLVLRDGAQGLEVLMVRRSPKASFMPGAYVFPGGGVDAADGSAEASSCCDEPADRLNQRIGTVAGVAAQATAFAVGALRECFEECGLWLGVDAGPAAAGDPGLAARLVALRARLHAGEPLAALAAAEGLPLATSVLQPFSHWVTPVGIPKRFDTLFFVAPAPIGQTPEPDAGETTTLAWVHPPQALADHRRGDFPMEFATVSTVRSLEPFAAGTAQALLAHAAAQAEVPPLHPRLKVGADGAITGVLLPGEPGYESGHQG